MKNITTNTLTTVLLIAVLCIVVEGMLFENGMTFFALFGVFVIYLSLKRHKRTFFWFGIILLLIALLSMWSLRLLVVATVLYILWRLRKGDPIQLEVRPLHDQQNTTFVKSKNKVFLFEDAPTESYTWKDVHMQNFIGEVTIDTTETILPKGSSFISVRQGFGKITIYVPYEIPVRIHFNTVVGEAKLMDEKYPRLWNESIALREGYIENEKTERELIISAASFFGDLEVIRK